MKLPERKLNRRQRRYFQKKYFFLFGFTCLFIAAIVGTFIFVSSQKQLYVSPLPFIKNIQTAFADDSTQIEKQMHIELKKKGIMYENVVMEDDHTFRIALKDNGTVFLTSEKDISQQIASLQVILVRLTMEGKKIAKLDMRFGKPVIVFQ